MHRFINSIVESNPKCKNSDHTCFTPGPSTHLCEAFASLRLPQACRRGGSEATATRGHRSKDGGEFENEPFAKVTFRRFRGKFTFRSGLIVNLVLISSFIITSCDGNKNSLSAGSAGRNMRIPVEVMVIEPKLLIDEIFTTGSILPNERVELRNEIAGRITGIFFDEGAYVNKGKLLLKINDSELKAQLNKIEAQESLIEQEVYRKQKLLDIKAISQEEYDIADIQLKSINAEKELLLAQITKTEVYAPFNGRIGLRHVSPGSYQAPNSIIASLQQIDQVKIEFSVPEKYSRELKPGMIISFNVENSSLNFEGKVYAVESSVDPQTRTITARAITNNKSGLLVPGTFARISLVLNRIPDALMIPSEALNTEIDGVFVYLYKDGKANSVPVVTGLRTPSEIQIVEGLQEGDSLIVTGLLQISNETPVDPKPVSDLVLKNDEN